MRQSETPALTHLVSQEELAKAERLSSMAELAASIAHEINQPLSAISSYAQASKRLIHTDAHSNLELISQTLDKICDQALRANEVVSRLRSLIKTRATQRQATVLATLINDTLQLAKMDSRAPLHHIQVELAAIQGVTLVVDPIQIQQVLLNLIQNAAEASEEVKLVARCISDESVEISVFDKGHGINDSLRAHIFTPFFSTKEEGMGIGLSVCKKIIDAHGGQLRFSANKPQGCVFSFSLPMAAHSYQPLE